MCITALSVTILLRDYHLKPGLFQCPLKWYFCFYSCVLLFPYPSEHSHCVCVCVFQFEKKNYSNGFLFTHNEIQSYLYPANLYMIWSVASSWFSSCNILPLLFYSVHTGFLFILQFFQIYLFLGAFALSVPSIRNVLLPDSLKFDLYAPFLLYLFFCLMVFNFLLFFYFPKVETDYWF